MAIQITSILCEGPHDVSFLAKILKTMGFTSNENTKLGQFPIPINKLFETEVKKANVEDLNLQEVRQALLPSNTLQRAQDYLFLYTMGGDGKKDSRNKILSEFLNFIPKEGEISIMPSDTRLSIIYFFDADDKGLTNRLSRLNQEVKEVTGEAIFTAHNQSIVSNGVKLGCFIFTGGDNNTGKLEDILVPLMKEDNEAIFENAQQYLDENHDSSRIFPLKLSIDGSGSVIEKRSQKSKHTDFDTSKSLIGIAGQLQRSGKQNTVYIGESDYLTLKKIQSNPKCLEIIHFLNGHLNM